MLAYGSAEASLRLLWRFGLLELLLPLQVYTYMYSISLFPFFFFFIITWLWGTILICCFNSFWKAAYFVRCGFSRRDNGSNMLLVVFYFLIKLLFSSWILSIGMVGVCIILSNHYSVDSISSCPCSLFPSFQFVILMCHNLWVYVWFKSNSLLLDLHTTSGPLKRIFIFRRLKRPCHSHRPCKPNLYDDVLNKSVLINGVFVCVIWCGLIQLKCWLQLFESFAIISMSEHLTVSFLVFPLWLNLSAI